MRLIKICKTTDKIDIKWQVPRKGGGWNTLSFGGDGKPRPGFEQAIMDLKPYFMKTGEIEKLNEKLVRSTGIILQYKGRDDVMNVFLTGYQSYECSKGFRNLKTPGKLSQNITGAPTATENVLDPECLKIVNKLIKETKLFLNGEEAQREMFKDGANPNTNPDDKKPDKKTEKKPDKKTGKNKSGNKKSSTKK